MKFNQLITLSFLFLLLPNISGAQETVQDSLWNKWQDETRKDTIRLGALQQFIRNIDVLEQPDSNIHLSQIQLDFARSKNNGRYIFEALYNLAWTYQKNNLPEKSIYYYKKAIEQTELNDDISNMAKMCTWLGTVYRDYGNFQESINYYQQALDLFEEVSNDDLKGRALIGLGDTYFNLGNFTRALQYYKQKLPMDEKSTNRLQLSGTLNQIGRVYHQIDEYQKALDYYDSALIIAKEAPDKLYFATIYMNIGIIHTKLKNFSKAEEYLNNALALSKELNALGVLAENRIFWRAIWSMAEVLIFSKQPYPISQMLALPMFARLVINGLMKASMF